MDIKDVENLAEMAKIELLEEEKTKLLADLQGILDYVKVIEAVDVKDIESKGVQQNVWREDEAQPSFFSRDLIIEQFPESQDGFLKVKKIL
jgi:aspartyl-tRNA(Asn)/glutamyl-tRNA(Gln) amidotransferase subunit C